MDTDFAGHTWMRDRDKQRFHLVPINGGQTLCRRFVFELDADNVAHNLFDIDDTLNVGVNPPADQQCATCVDRFSERRSGDKPAG